MSKRGYNLSFRYGITQEEYKKRMKEQGSKCLICKVKDSQLHVDHCHVSLKVRGLLCRACNTGIGLLKDNKRNLRNAITYLERGKKKNGRTSKKSNKA
jgi:Recombination endonuclease VII